jgi:putative two-component system response regulator
MNQPASILVVDDMPANRKLLRRVLEEEGHSVREAGDGLEALEKVAESAPDLLLLDVMMPGLDGFGVCRRLKGDPATRLLPILILTSLDQIPDKVKALDLDANDYLTKPFNLTELRSRVRSMLRLKRFTDEMENAAAVLRGMAFAVEKRDAYVSDHCREAAFIAARLGMALGLDETALGRLRLGATFHDIGKIGVPDAVLRKAGPLDAAETLAMRRHAADGAALLEPMHTLRDVVPLVRHHHERLDGSGYPDGLKGDQISLELRILSVVDVYQALVAERPYKKPMPRERALDILREESLRGWWDPRVVEGLGGLPA